jgi:Fur family peroxide stress response transcriptional regulator
LRIFLFCAIVLFMARPVQTRHEALAATFHAAGLRVTPQRLAVLRVLLRSHDHPAPEAVFQRVRGDLPSVSLATVYKVLASLEAAGLASRVGVPGDANRYDANRAPHHHLICTRCGNVADHEDPRLAPALPRDLGGFVPSEARVQILGLCARCRARHHPQHKEKREKTWRS